MICQELHLCLQAYLDGELPPSKTLEAEAHLEACRPCRQAAEAEQAFRKELRKKLLPEPVPPHLEEKLRSAMAELEGRDRRRSPQPTFERRAWLVAASVLLLTLGGVLGYLIAQPVSRPGLSPLVQELVAEHMKSALLENPVDLSSRNTQQVAFWFQGKIEHPIRVPDYSLTGIQLLGGRVTQLGDRRVASIVYEKGRKMISLFAFSRYKASLTGLDEIRRDGQVFFAGESRGQQMLLWDRGEMMYALVSDIGWDELFQCARVFFQGESS